MQIVSIRSYEKNTAIFMSTKDFHHEHLRDTLKHRVMWIQFTGLKQQQLRKQRQVMFKVSKGSL